MAGVREGRITSLTYGPTDVIVVHVTDSDEVNVSWVQTGFVHSLQQGSGRCRPLHRGRPRAAYPGVHQEHAVGVVDHPCPHPEPPRTPMSMNASISNILGEQRFHLGARKGFRDRDVVHVEIEKRGHRDVPDLDSLERHAIAVRRSSRGGWNGAHPLGAVAWAYAGSARTSRQK